MFAFDPEPFRHLDPLTKGLLNPLGANQFRVITKQDKLNKLLERKLLPKRPQLLKFRFLILEKTIHLRGVIKEPEDLPKRFKTGNIWFDMKLEKEEVFADAVFLYIRKFRAYSPGQKIDLIKWIDRFSNRVRREILAGITRTPSPLKVTEDNEKRIAFDLNFILKRIPSEMNMLGKVRILNVAFEKKQIIWYIESNLLQRSILDGLGPEYAEVDKIDPLQDSLRLLTDFPFDWAANDNKTES